MKIAEVMTRDVRTIGPDRSVRDAARIMDEMNVGVLPVCDGRRLLGMLTDRDIAVRSTAAGIAPDRHRVREIMSTSLQWCFEEDDAEDVLRHMSERQIRRMPVVDGERRLVGIVALGDLAADNAPGTDEALRRISSPSEPDRSGTPTAPRADETRRAGRDPLTPEEHRELDRRARKAERGGGGGGRSEGAPDVGPPGGDLQGFPSDYTGYGSRGLRDEDLRRAEHGSGEGWRGFGRGRGPGGGFRFRDEDDHRAAFPGGFNEAYGEGRDRGARMPGGFGGDGYNAYGGPGARGVQGRGAQGGGGPGYDDFSGHGSRPGGIPRRIGTEGEENYDRGIRSGREDSAPWGGNRFSNKTAGYGRARGAGPHHGRGPKGHARSDARIHEDVCERLTDDPHVDASEIEVRVENGEVTLSGTVPDRSAKRRVEDIAEGVPGVRHVQNDLRIQGQSQGQDQAQTRAGAGTGGGGTVSGGTPEPGVAERTDTETPGTSGGAAGTTAGSRAGARVTGDPAKA
jgi:CBS domain-containing protein